MITRRSVYNKALTMVITLDLYFVRLNFYANLSRTENILS